MKRRTGIITVFLAIVLSVNGCSKNAQTEEEFNISTSTSPITIDPQLITDSASLYAEAFFMSTLYEYDKDLNLAPCLAKGYDLSDDGLTYTFHLVKGLKWSDGRKLSAEDFVFAFKRIADPDVGSNAIYLIQDCCKIKNVDDVVSGKKPVSELGVSAPDDLTFVVELEEPCPYFISLLTQGDFAPCNEDFYNMVGDNYANSDETVLSCGPYIIDRYEPIAMQIHFSKNPYYVNKEEITIPGVNMQVVANSEQSMMDFQVGDMDVTAVGGELADLCEGDDRLKDYSKSSTTFFLLNGKMNSAFDNQNIRLAISKCINREGLATGLLKTGYDPLTRAIPPEFYKETDGTDFAGDVDRYDKWAGYDKEEAKKLWNKGLKELDMSKISFSITYAAGEDSIILACVQDMKDTLPGIEVNLNKLTFKDLLSHMRKLDFDMLLTSWSPDYIDPSTYLEQFNATYGAFYDTDYNNMLEEIGSSEMALNPDARNEAMHKAEDILMEKAGMIPLFCFGKSYLIQDNVKGFQMNPAGTAPIIPELSKEVK